MTKLKKGDKAPQFIIFSFDGAGSDQKWNLFLDAAEKTDSRLVGFLTGLYLVEDANRDAYQGPGYEPGRSTVGFGGTKQEVITLIENLNKAYASGSEIGTHYNGHFCGSKSSGNSWSTADWNTEIGQFMKFLSQYVEVNGWQGDVPELKVKPADINGGRTPCLEGDIDAMAPAWKKFGLTYDASLNTKTGITWPVKTQGIWEFEMPRVYSPGFGGNVMAMDYNFGCKFAGDCSEVRLSGPDWSAELRPKVRATYEFMYEQAYNGNRAPVQVANHFNNWNGDSYNRPALEFMKETCGKPDTYCATYQDVIAWMELQDPAVLAGLQAKPAVAAGP